VDRTTFANGGVSRIKGKCSDAEVSGYCECLLPSYFQIVYKKGHDERKSKYTSLPDPPDVEQAKKVTRQLSDVSRMQCSSFRRNLTFGVREAKWSLKKGKAKEKSRAHMKTPLFFSGRIQFLSFSRVSEKNPAQSQVKGETLFLSVNSVFTKHFYFCYIHITSYSPSFFVSCFTLSVFTGENSK